MSNPYFDIEDDGDDLTVTGVTPAGLGVLVDITLMIDEGASVEEVCERFGMSQMEFRIFYTTCNLTGAVDIVRQAQKTVAESA